MPVTHELMARAGSYTDRDGNEKTRWQKYCPAMESIGKQFWHREIERDDDYIEAMGLDLIAFEKLVSEYESKLRAA